MAEFHLNSNHSMSYVKELLIVFTFLCSLSLFLGIPNAYAASYMQNDTYGYQNLFNIAPSFMDSAVISNGSGVVAFSDDSRIFYSSNGIDFSQSDTSNLGNFSPPLYGGCGSNGKTIIFGEYVLDPGMCRLIRSTDGGATFNVVLTLNDPVDRKALALCAI